MKKLITAAAVALVGVTVNASTCSWVADGILAYDVNDGGAVANNYLVYYVDSSLITSSALADELKTGNFGTLNAWGYESAFAADAGYTEGSGATGTTGEGGVRIKAEYDKSKAITPNFYLVVLDADTQEDASHFFIAGAYTANTPTTTSGGNASAEITTFTGMGDHTNWGTVAVPEPTSGLLLLLGVAGLALKRKRA